MKVINFYFEMWKKSGPYVHIMRRVFRQTASCGRGFGLFCCETFEMEGEKSRCRGKGSGCGNVSRASEDDSYPPVKCTAKCRMRRAEGWKRSPS